MRSYEPNPNSVCVKGIPKHWTTDDLYTAICAMNNGILVPYIENCRIITTNGHDNYGFVNFNCAAMAQEFEQWEKIEFADGVTLTLSSARYCKRNGHSVNEPVMQPYWGPEYVPNEWHQQQLHQQMQQPLQQPFQPAFQQPLQQHMYQQPLQHQMRHHLQPQPHHMAHPQPHLLQPHYQMGIPVANPNIFPRTPLPYGLPPPSMAYHNEPQLEPQYVCPVMSVSPRVYFDQRAPNYAYEANQAPPIVPPPVENAHQPEQENQAGTYLDQKKLRSNLLKRNQLL